MTGRPIDPLVKALLIEIDEAGVSMESVSLDAGLGKDTIGMWSRSRRVPSLMNMRAALGVFGIKLVAIKPSRKKG